MPKPKPVDYKKKYQEAIDKLNRGASNTPPPAPKQRPAFKIPDFKPDLGKIDDSTDVNELIQKLIAGVDSHVKSVVSQYQSHNETIKKEDEAEANAQKVTQQIREFQSKLPPEEWAEKLERMNYYFQKGHPIEECYRLAKVDAKEDPQEFLKPKKDKKGAKDEDGDGDVIEDDDQDGDANPGSSTSLDDLDEAEIPDTSLSQKPKKDATLKDLIKMSVDQGLKKNPELAKL